MFELACALNNKNSRVVDYEIIDAEKIILEILSKWNLLARSGEAENETGKDRCSS